jgi:hypothetical protein
MLFRSRFNRRSVVIAVCAVFAIANYNASAAQKVAEKPAGTAAAQSQNKADQSKYIRIARDTKDRVIGLDTAIISFRPATPRAADVEVDLVAAVHVADKGYYEELNKRFKGYDVVLYELVAPEGTRIPKGGRKDKGGNVVSSVQIGMKNALELDYQLDQIDYTRKNFVHADLSPDEFLKSMRDHHEGFADIIARLLALGIAKEANGQGGNDMQLLFALFDKNRALALKRVVAEQFEDVDGGMAVLEGPKGSTLIGERNKRALEVLSKQLAKGKKKIAIFYGGGHMTDMEKHLRAEFSMKPEKTEWVRAWDMK